MGWGTYARDPPIELSEVFIFMRILTVFGTRPEAIKLAPVVKSQAAESNVTSRACMTAPHSKEAQA
jgi:UDP-N-acetylglucosamine 2-epimerase